MRKKVTAILTSFLFAASVMPLHSLGWGKEELITHIVYDENGAPYLYLVADGYTFSDGDVEKYYDGEPLQCGDLVNVNCDTVDPICPGICNFVEGNSIEYVGRSTDFCEILTLTVTKRTANSLYVQDEFGTEYVYKKGRLIGEYVDDSIYPGETVKLVRMDGEPDYTANADLLGDVNADGTLNILDVILMNKCVLTGDSLPVLESTARSTTTDLGPCDFNANGILDVDDSLGMLKRILRLG